MPHFSRNMKIVIVGIIFVIGIIIGMLLSPARYSHRQAGPMTNHEHVMYEVSSGAAVPVVDLELVPDSVSGYNLHIDVQNFRFAPENVGGTHFENEGHAHLYIDGVKIGRVYSEWIYLGELPSKDSEILVHLSTNDHREYVRSGELIKDTIIIE